MRAWDFLVETFGEWSEDRAPRLGAALAYYTVFSLAPILVIAIAIAGLVFGREAVQGQVLQQIEHLVGPQGAEAIRAMVASAEQDEGRGIVATIFGVAALLFGASGVFGELQDSLNQIWDVKPKEGRGLWGTVKDRFFSFAMVLGVGFLLLVSQVIATALTAFGDLLGRFVPEAALYAVNFTVSLAVVSAIFAVIFKVLPDAEIRWRDVIPGAVVTALLFGIGRYAIGLYLGTSGLSSAYGAAGSLVVVLVWVYYSAQILFFGAEFTRVWARRRGRAVAPAAGAEPREPELERVPTVATWGIAAVAAALGYAVGRTPPRRLLRQTPDTLSTAVQVTSAVAAVDRFRRRRDERPGHRPAA